MSATDRIVVTGIGATTPLGGTAPETWEGLLAGRSGARPLEEDWVEGYGLPVTFAARLATPPTEVLKKVEIRRCDPFTQYALIAAREAWEDAGAPDVEPERFGVAVGTGIGGVHSLLDQYDVLKEKGPRRIYPLTVPMLMPNAAAGFLSLEFGARAGAHSTVSACSSGAESMGYGADLIRKGRADIVIAGGSEAAIHPLPISGFAAAHALSTRNDDPQAASRPWDNGRDGFLLAEGAGIIVLESYEHAMARGAKIYGELASVGMSADAYHITAGEPEGKGAARAMTEAVQLADVSLTDIKHINAHATSTPVGDAAEAAAIRRAFGEHASSIALTGTKSMTGHLLGAAGALETVIAIQTVHHRTIPATINLDERDEQFADLDIVHGEPRALPDGDVAVLNNSFGFGGHNIAVVVKNV
ncbi:beta-ketoacyl-ACP synthase II [Demetria terragena]|uniref:beta-ketoacyl-ACP synthase II n=1 Tax=Demetria terragena TaxID=63959 RepID=UPI0003691EE8|nr:beta-ketoacyl-ACP synthase II [Demetria terragena]